MNTCKSARRRLGVMMAAVTLSLATFADILPEGAFWNKDTAYQPATPESAVRAFDADEDFSFTSTWDLTLLFICDFYGNPARGLLYYIP